MAEYGNAFWRGEKKKKEQHFSTSKAGYREKKDQIWVHSSSDIWSLHFIKVWKFILNPWAEKALLPEGLRGHTSHLLASCLGFRILLSQQAWIERLAPSHVSDPKRPHTPSGRLASQRSATPCVSFRKHGCFAIGYRSPKKARRALLIYLPAHLFLLLLLLQNKGIFFQDVT